MIRIFSRSLIVSGTAALALAGTAGAALANDCANFSRTAPACWYSDAGCTTPVVRGTWAFLPSLEPGTPPIWVFGPPANFTNGQSDALTALADLKSGGAVCATPNRQLSSGLDGLKGVLSTDACGFFG